MPLSKLRDLSYGLKKRILTVLGDVKVFKWPCFFIYQPTSYKLDGTDFSLVERSVRKYDVLLRCYESYLDTHFIPGFWNHAGIYTGQSNARNGSVVHALSDGVVQQTLFDFLKTDHVMLLRPTFKFAPVDVDKRIQEALGKEYDFNFDFHDDDKMSCTELVRFAFKDSAMALQADDSHLGQPVLFPDSIAKSPDFSTVLEIIHT